MESTITKHEQASAIIIPTSVPVSSVILPPFLFVSLCRSRYIEIDKAFDQDSELLQPNDLFGHPCKNTLSIEIQSSFL
jgi:hypothetical protein